jgi:hypothetical protein
MTSFTSLTVSKKQVKDDLKDFRALLNDPSRPDLDERLHILPFFRSHPNLSAFMGFYNPLITSKKTELAFEFDIFGDHVADLAIGDATNHQYCFIEFEDASETSIFTGVPGDIRQNRQDLRNLDKIASLGRKADHVREGQGLGQPFVKAEDP